MEAAQRFLESKERSPVGSEGWARATARAFDILTCESCDEVVKPEWWNDEGLKALSAGVLRAAPNEESALDMRANVLSGFSWGTWEPGPRSAAELEEAATYFERSAALSSAPAVKAAFATAAGACRRAAEAMHSRRGGLIILG